MFKKYSVIKFSDQKKLGISTMDNSEKYFSAYSTDIDFSGQLDVPFSPITNWFDIIQDMILPWQ